MYVGLYIYTVGVYVHATMEQYTCINWLSQFYSFSVFDKLCHRFGNTVCHECLCQSRQN